jgi:putative PIN family toxin of toxin-antitoxin system
VPNAKLRVVLDTNVVLSALLFSRGKLAWLRDGWSSHGLAVSFLPLICKSTVSELLRVLTYPKFQLSRDEIEVMLSGYVPFCETMRQWGRIPTGRLPTCRDRHEQIFLELSAAGHADVLVTGDKALLELGSQVPFAIENPSRFKKRLEIKNVSK